MSPARAPARLAYGGCARNTSGNQTSAVLPKRCENSHFFAANKKKDNAKVDLASSKRFLRIPGLTGRGTTYFFQNNTMQLISYLVTLDELLASCHDSRRRPIFGAKFLQSDTVFGIVSHFSWKGNSISSEKRDLILMLYLLTYIDVMTVIFSACWILIDQFKYEAQRPHARRKFRGTDNVQGQTFEHIL